VDRLYPALEMRLYLSRKLSLASGQQMAIRNLRAIRAKKSETQFDFDDTWTAPFQPDDDLDDIFMMSSHESSAESRAEDEESLYSDALSRKASIVSLRIRVNERESDFVLVFVKGSIHT